VDLHVEQLKKEGKRKKAEEGSKAKQGEEGVPLKKKKFFRDKSVKEEDAAAKKEKKAQKAAERKELKEKAEKQDKLARRAERKQNKESAEKAKKKEKTKSKFSISLSVGSNDVETADPPKKVSTGKGPKIIIAKEKGAKKEEKELSKRKKKQLKKEMGGVSTGSESSKELAGCSKALSYLKTWAEDRESWKFEKCRQIWLINHIYDTDNLPEDSFPSLLEYLGSIKGGMRDKVLEGAKRKVESYVKWEEQMANPCEGAESANVEEVTEAVSDRALQVLEKLKSTS